MPIDVLKLEVGDIVDWVETAVIEKYAIKTLHNKSWTRLFIPRFLFRSNRVSWQEKVWADIPPTLLFWAILGQKITFYMKFFVLTYVSPGGREHTSHNSN